MKRAACSWLLLLTPFIVACFEDVASEGSGTGSTGADVGTTTTATTTTATTTTATTTVTTTTEGARTTSGNAGTGSSSSEGGEGSSGEADSSTGGTEPIILLYAVEPMDGDFLLDVSSARETVDQMCEFGEPSEASCTTHHALISIAEDDSIANFETMHQPPRLPIESATGIRVAQTWDALGGPNPMLTNSLLDAGVTFDAPWTGSDHDGSYVSTSVACSDWTVNTFNIYGAVGDDTATGSGWRRNELVPCDELHPVLCVCWD